MICASVKPLDARIGLHEIFGKYKKVITVGGWLSDGWIWFCRVIEWMTITAIQSSGEKDLVSG